MADQRGQSGDLVRLSEGDAIVEGEIVVAAHGYLRRVFHVGGRYFGEIEAWADGYGTFIAPLRAIRLRSTGAMPQPPGERPAVASGAV